jgi:prepilin-type processing-associated H-X9-DG protein
MTLTAGNLSPQQLKIEPALASTATKMPKNRKNLAFMDGH